MNHSLKDEYLRLCTKDKYSCPSTKVKYIVNGQKTRNPSLLLKASSVFHVPKPNTFVRVLCRQAFLCPSNKDKEFSQGTKDEQTCETLK